MFPGNPGGNVRVVSDDAHLKGLGQARHFSPDAAEADQPQRLRPELNPQEAFLLPQSLFERAVSLGDAPRQRQRSEEHTSELQSLAYLVCRLLLEKKNKQEHTHAVRVDS